MAESFLERNGTLFQILAAVLLAVITGLLTWYIGYRNRATKTLDYWVISDLAIVSSHNRPDRLKIMLGTIEVDNPFVTLIRFRNTGKQVIERDDFLRPIEICRGNTEVVDWNVVNQTEPNLADDIGLVAPVAGDKEFDEHISIKPNTLNPGDTFDVQITYDGTLECQPEITVRIKGQTRKMEALVPRSAAREMGFYITLVGVAVGVFSGFFASRLIAGGGNQLLTFSNLVVVVSVTTALIAVVGIVRSLERKRFWG